MAITQAYSGTATISTTEISLVSGTTTLQSITTPAVIQLFVDVSAMASGDEYRIQVKDKIVSGGTQLTIYDSYINGKQSTPFVTPSLILFHGWDITMDLITGTARSITWSIRKVG